MPETPVGYLPDYRLDGGPLKFGKRRRVLVETAVSGREQRLLQGLPRRFWGYRTRQLTQDERQVLEAFLDSRYGEFGAFYFIDQAPQSLVAFNAGTAASGTSFVTPIKGFWYLGETPVAATYSGVTIGGAAKTVTATPNIGTGGEDRISWTGTAGGTVILNATFARVRVVARNASESLDVEYVPNIVDLLSKFPILITELVTP